MGTTPNEPYQNLPPLPPAAEVETPRVLKAVISASRKMAALDAACRRLPDPALLINTIPLLEAQASSEIENIVTTNDEVFRAAHNALNQPATPAIKEALRYREALNAGYQALQQRPLSTNSAIKVCSHLMGYEVQIRQDSGTYIGNPSTQERFYTPPQGRDVIQEHLKAWETFIHGNHGIDPLVAMSLLHYQFEAIHPFGDGNGRTGRVLNLLYLVEQKMLTLPVLYLSGYVVRHKDEYYRRLRAVTEQDAWEDWILYMVEACEVMASWTLQLIETISTQQTHMEETVRALVPRAPAAELTRLLFTQPYIRIEHIVRTDLAQRQAAARWLATLSDHNVLTREQIGRSLLFVNQPLLNTLFTAPLSD